MRTINLFVVHCSATREDCTLSPEALDVMHRRRGFNGTGYHYYIRKDGTLYLTRSLERIGAHAKGFNAHSIGIAMKVVWTAGDTRQIPGLRRSGLRSGNLWPIWSCVSLAAGYAGIAIFHRT